MVDFGETRCSAYKISAERRMTLHGPCIHDSHDLLLSREVFLMRVSLSKSFCLRLTSGYLSWHHLGLSSITKAELRLHKRLS
jgi:hypothetical protein